MSTDVVTSVLPKGACGSPLVEETMPNVFRLTYTAEQWAKRVSSDVEALKTLGDCATESFPMAGTAPHEKHPGEVLIVKMLAAPAPKAAPKNQPDLPKKGA